jgi:hypothetical protein
MQPTLLIMRLSCSLGAYLAHPPACPADHAAYTAPLAAYLAPHRVYPAQPAAYLAPLAAYLAHPSACPDIVQPILLLLQLILLIL